MHPGNDDLRKATDTEQQEPVDTVAYCLEQAKGVLDRATENLQAYPNSSTDDATWLAAAWRDLATAYKEHGVWVQVADVTRRVNRMLG